jgi:hypothetical protein
VKNIDRFSVMMLYALNIALNIALLQNAEAYLLVFIEIKKGSNARP